MKLKNGKEMIKKLKKMEATQQYTGWRNKKKTKTVLKKIKNGLKILNILESGVKIENQDLVFSIMAVGTNMKETG